MNSTRRTVLKSGAGVGAIAMGALAGCVGDEGGADDGAGADDGVAADDTDGSSDAGDDHDDDDGSEAAPEHTVTLLVEGVGGHDHDHDDDHHDDYDHDDDHHDHGGELDSHAIDHACGHMEFDEPEAIDGAASEADAHTITEVHQPYDVNFDGDEAYVLFEADDDGHDHDHDDDDHHDDDHDHGDGSMFGFFTRGGSVEVVSGHVEHEEHDVGDCGDIDMYVVADAEENPVTLRITP